MCSQEGQYEKEGYGQRPYDNWETIMLDCEKLVGSVCGQASLCVMVQLHPAQMGVQSSCWDSAVLCQQRAVAGSCCWAFSLS